MKGCPKMVEIFSSVTNQSSSTKTFLPLPYWDIRHKPVSRPPFLHQFVTKYPFFATLHQMTPYYYLLDQNVWVKASNIEKKMQITAKISKKKSVLKLPGLCNFTPKWLPFFGSVTQWPLFCKKLSLMTPWFDALVGTSPSLLWVSPPSGVNLYVCKGKNRLWELFTDLKIFSFSADFSFFLLLKFTHFLSFSGQF